MISIYTNKAPEPIGPYVQGVDAGGFIFTSMQLPIDPITPDRIYDSIEEEAEQLIKNVFAVVKEGGGEISSILKVTLYITDLNLFTVVNDVYAKMFGNHEPARSVVNVPAIPKGYRLAMEAIAIKNS